MNIHVSYEGYMEYKSNVIPVIEKKIFCKTAICKMNTIELFEDMFLVFITARVLYVLHQVL